jgi:hypothetical protein
VGDGGDGIVSRFKGSGFKVDWLNRLIGLNGLLSTDPSSLIRASGFVKTSPDRSPRKAPHRPGVDFSYAAAGTHKQNIILNNLWINQKLAHNSR